MFVKCSFLNVLLDAAMRIFFICFCFWNSWFSWGIERKDLCIV